MGNTTSKSVSHKIAVGEGIEARDIAVQHRSSGSKDLGLMWLGGYRSDMEGSKAIALDEYAGEHGLACLRHDYSGHGQSGGKFIDGTISRWLEESLAVFDAYSKGPQILVGSSMGGWIAIRLAQELKRQGKADRIKALLLLAPAPDFTRELHGPKITDAQKQDLEDKGCFEVPTPYGPDPNVFTKALFDDGEKNLVLNGLIDIGVPVHIIQGMEDPDVPWQHAMRLVEHLPMEDVVLTLIRDGDHRLSRASDIEKILQSVDGLRK